MSKKTIFRVNKGGDYMYKELEAELARKGMTKKDLALKTGIRYQTLNSKLRREYPLTFDECLKIKKALQSTIPLENLFYAG
jgi:lambda repressor-like predicted transcriptional regulator